MSPELIEKLQTLADKYEISSFCDEDPSQFLRWYPLSQIADVECASFIAAMLAFGNRKQFIPKIRQILQMADEITTANTPSALGIASWCMSGAPGFPTGEKKFYRFYSYDDMHCLFEELGAIINQAGTLGDFFKNLTTAKAPSAAPDLASAVSSAFPKSAIVPKGANSANKRVHMFLRWMVRRNSQVDLGLWQWADPAGLLIPLDVHVMQEAIGLGLLPESAKATRKTAEMLSAAVAVAFPGDPSRADFALFGLGVDK